ncbi:MAG: acetate--CoA ligase family protein [Ignavibacteria bacterium]|nr:acetate--CoA ligase family protein [Ignavibacteria bacterium]
MSDILTLSNFFYPKSVLLIGASSKPKSIGYEILKAMIGFEFKGKIYVVNPNSEEILGIKCNKTIEEITEPIDLAIILLPKQLVYEGLKSCAKKQINNVIIITAGFKEVGEDGAKLEKEITLFAKENGIRLIGPNCMGLINTDEQVRLNATFAAEVPHFAPISFLSQSGALAAAVLNTIRQTGYTFGQFVSIGNKADVNENDLLEFWWKDENTKIITMYLESFENGRKFFELSKNVTKEKPVIVLKAARTKSGTSAASSHTGALATQDDIVEAALRQSGVIRVNTIEEMFETAKAILKFGKLNGNKIAVLTNAGGPAILCVDELEKNSLTIPELQSSTKIKLKEILHPEASLKNPVDMLPGADSETYRNAVKIISQDPNIDGLIVIFVEPVMIDSFEVIKALAEEQKENEKPILIVAFPLPHFWERWKSEGISDSLILKSVELAPKILKNIFHYHTHKHQKEPFVESLDKETSKKISKTLMNAKVLQNSSGFLSSQECHQILKALDLPIVKSKFIQSENDLNKIAKDISYPCVLKISSRKLTHKSDVKGVILNISNKKELKEAFREIKSNLQKKKLLSLIEGFEVQEFFNGEIELIIGAYRDNSFGPVVNFGAGGKLVEIIKDKNLALPPLSISEATKLIEQSKVYPLLTKFRDFEEVDITKLAKLIQKISQLIYEFEEIKEIDLNPVMVKGKKLKIVDYRILI